tara:strand:- start:41 stop:2092 length:2052 start_codon:yes stop_codon:yes gene_type:complete
MSSLKDQILDLRDELMIAKDEGKLTPDGQKMLDQLETKSWTTGGFGQFMQGLTANFSDSVIGSIKSYLSPAPTAIAKQVGMATPDQPPPSPSDVGVAMERIGLEEYSKESPVKSVAANIVGAATPAFLTKRPITSLPAQAGITTLSGVTAGIGESEAELFSPESMKSGAVGGATALTMLPLTKGLSMAGGTVYRGVVKSIFDNPQKLGTDEARSLIKQALVADVGGVDEAIKYVLERKGKPYALADVGANTRAYLDAANTIPSVGKATAKNFIEQRDKGILSRLTTDLQVAFGSKAAFFDEFNALKQARSQLGGALYDRALKKDIPVTSELVSLMDRPSVKNAFVRAQELAKEQGVKLPDVQVVNGKLVTSDGSPVTSINTTFLHYVKMGLDDGIFTGKSPTSGIGSTQLNAFKDTRSNFLALLDSANGTYKNARRVWASDTAVMDAMEEGRTIFNKSPKDVDILLNDMKTMTKSELEGLRLGTMQNLLDRIGGAQVADTVVGATGNPALKIINNPKNLRIIRETFPKDEAGDKSFGQFIKNLKTEVEMKSTSKQVLQGSQTAERTQAIQDVRAGGKAMREMPVMSIQGILTRALQRDYANLGDEQTRAVATEMVRILTTTDPKKLQKIGKELAGRSLYDVISKDVPELLPALGRTILSPSSVGIMSGTAAPNTQNAMGLFSQ